MLTRIDRGHQINLEDQAILSTWPTPNSGPQNDSDTKWEARREANKQKHINGNGFGLTLGMASQLSTWPTPTDRDYKDGSAQACQHVPENALLGRVVHQTGWQTPKVAQGKYQYANGNHEKRWLNLEGEADLTLGTNLNGSTAETANTGQLNPAFVRWLMGYPAAWDVCADTATASCRRSPQRSSRPI